MGALDILDTLELRELRLKVKQKSEPRESMDGDWRRPGWVREPDGRDEELRVTLSQRHRRGDRPAVAPRDPKRRGHDRGGEELLHADRQELQNKPPTADAAGSSTRNEPLSVTQS